MSLFAHKSSPPRFVTAAVAIAASSLLLAGCGGSSGSSGSGGGSGSGSSSKNLAVTFMPKSLGNKYFEASDKGGKTAVTEFKGTFKEAGATEASATSQSPFIQTATQQHAGAIVPLAPKSSQPRLSPTQITLCHSPCS